MNGLCPACRRRYDDKDIEYKVITAEETAAYKARQAQKQKKTQAALQKEKQKAEADSLSRKHLAGLRVVQKNLVYVTGITPKMQEDELLQTLRGEKYFGQYGKIIKIVVSKARDKHDSVGVYVTYELKEDAASCIAAVDGTINGDRTLRAQFGTTKYCSAYLRGDTCMNRSCMFLHEPGEANESYSRADLSALNAGSTQHGGAKLPPPQSQQPVSAAQPMARQGSDQPHSPISTDRPALPSTASWASKPTQSSRAESRSTSGTVGSPAPMTATPAPSQPEQPAHTQENPNPPQAQATAPAPQMASRPPQASRTGAPSPLHDLLRKFDPKDLCFVFSPTSVPELELAVISNYPALFDANGGARRRLRKQREEESRRMEQEAQAFQQPPPIDAVDAAEDAPEMSGSMQLGGEPEDRQGLNHAQGAIHPPAGDGTLDQRFQFGGGVASPSDLSERRLTPQQHQQLLLQTMKSPNAQSGYANQPNTFQQSSQPPGHQRNASRFSFANDTSASTAVKPVANPKVLNQQSSMMPTAGSNHFGNQLQGSNFFTSNVQGPPPGLKTTGTPPVSGGMTFGQGHGFTTGGLPYGSAAVGTRNPNEEMMRDLLRGRGADAAAKRESPFPYSTPSSAAGSAAYTPVGNSGPYPNSMSAPYASSLSSYGAGDVDKHRKKKGKKHRHGNASTSSGGVDVSGVDGHLLQARLQHGVGAGVGASAFGSQSGPGGLYNSVMHGGNGYGGRWK